MNVRVFDWYIFSQGPIVWKSALKTNEDVLWYFSSGGNRIEYVGANHSHTHGNDTWWCPLSHRQIYFQLPSSDASLSAILPQGASHKAHPHRKIERGFNEGEMYLTFECHSLLLSAVLWLLRDKATPLWQTLIGFMRMVFKKSNKYQ